MLRFARMVTLKNAFVITTGVVVCVLAGENALEAQSLKDRLDAVQAARNANNTRSGTVEIGGQKYVVNAMLKTTYVGTTATATVQKDGVEIGRAAMDRNGVISVTSPDPQDTDAKKAAAGIVYQAVTKFKADQENAATGPANGTSAATPPPPQQPAGFDDPNAARRAQVAADAARMQERADQLAMRAGVGKQGQEAGGDLKVQFTTDGNVVTGVLVTDDKGPITLNPNATQIEFDDPRQGHIRMTHANISAAKQAGNTVRGLLTGAVSGGGAVTTGHDFYVIEVREGADWKKLGTTADHTGGAGMRAFTKEGQRQLNKVYAARAFQAVKAAEDAAQTQKANFQPDPDARGVLEKASRNVSPSALNH